MPTLLQSAVLAILAAFVGLHLLWAWRLALAFRSPAASSPGGELPPAAVILSLRGADPALTACLTGLLRQDYPHYRVYIVVDSRTDPAWEAVQRCLAAQSEPGVEVHVDVLHRPRDTCSLKVSAQLEAVRRLDDSVEVVALIDADVVPWPGWLRALVLPLADGRVGATTGVRWYAPPDARWGTLVRYLWNAGACAQMHAWHIPWGGSLAFRASVFRDSDLLERWAHSFCEDTGSYTVLRALGLQLRYVPAAVSINRESIGLGGCTTFARRQLLCARLHHLYWPAILTANAGLGLALAAALVVGLIALGNETWEGMAWLGVLLGTYVGGFLIALCMCEQALRRIVAARGEAASPLPLSLKWLLMGPLVLGLHFLCLVQACCLRQVEWRGITYVLEGRGKLHLLAYRPYAPPVEDVGKPDVSVL